MTKVTIVSGFLGAGKTTLIRKLLEQVFTGEKIVLIENEYGEIGIDGGFLKDAGVIINEMNSGCICCTLVGDFTAALQQVIRDYAPDRIIIEPSGVGKLSDIIAAVEKVKAYADLTITERLAVVDAKKAKVYMKNFGEFFLNQIQYASTIILSRTQLVDEARLAEVVALIREQNAEVPLITTPWDELPADAVRHAFERSDVENLLLPLEEEEEEEHHHHHHHHHDGEECDDPECCCHHHHDDDDEDEHEHHHHHHDDDDEDDEHEHHHHHHDGEECDDPECCCHHHHDDDDDDEDEHEHHHHHDDDHGHHHHHHHHHGHDADEVFTSWGRETARKYDPAELDEILKALQAEDGRFGRIILRAKGIVPMTDGSWKQFDLVPEESETRACSPDYTGRLCVIGCELREDKLAELFGL